MRVEKQIAALQTAIQRLLRDYKSEWCGDPKCGVCKRSRQAKEYAETVVKTVADHQAQTVKTVYTVPHHVGEVVEVPSGMRVLFYD